VHLQATIALARLCSRNNENQQCVGACGGVAALVGLLAPRGPAAVQERAAKALANVCAGNALNQDSARECGGVAALVALLAPGGSDDVRVVAAWALCNLCTNNTRNQDSVRVCGGIPALIALSNTAAAHKGVAGALVNMTGGSAANREAVRACGGVAALERVLACPSSAAAHMWALSALRNLGQAQAAGGLHGSGFVVQAGQHIYVGVEQP